MMSGLLPDSVAYRIAWTLLHFFWQGLVVAALFGLALRIAGSPRPRVRYALGLVALLLMALCPLITFSCAPQLIAESSRATASALPFHREADLFEKTIGPPQKFSESRPTMTLSAVESTPVARAPTEVSASMSAGQAGWPRWVLSIWCLGVVLLSIRLCGVFAQTLWLQRHTQELEPLLLSRARRLAGRLGMSCCRVASSTRVTEAMAIGFWRPMVLLPASWIVELPAEVLEAVIAHELAHIRRHDLWVMLLQRGLETLLFYHPAVWWVSRRVCLEREKCCDELAVFALGQRLGYARALETVARRESVETVMTRTSPAWSARPSGSLVAPISGVSRMHLLGRVRSVLGLRAEPETAVAWPAGLMVLGLCLGIVTWSFSTSRADDEPKKEDTKVEEKQEESKEDKPKEEDKGREAGKRDEDKREERKGEEDKREDGNREEGKREEEKKDERKGEEGKREEGKREEEKGDERQRDDVKRDERKGDERKSDDGKREEGRREEKKRDDGKRGEPEKKRDENAERKKEGRPVEKSEREIYAEKVRRAAGKDRGDGEAERDGVKGFKPATDREEALLQMIQSLQREVSHLQKEVAQMRGERGDRDGARNGREAAGKKGREGDKEAERRPADRERKEESREGRREEKGDKREGREESRETEKKDRD